MSGQDRDVAGLRQRRLERGLPVGPIVREDTGEEGQTKLRVMDEVARLKGLGWAELRREAKALGIPEAKIGGAATRDEVRLAILEVKIAEAMS